MAEPQKRIVLTRFWIGDTVYHVMDGERAQVVQVQIIGDRFCARYYCVFGDRKGEWCEEMELSDQKVFETAGETAKHA